MVAARLGSLGEESGRRAGLAPGLSHYFQGARVDLRVVKRRVKVKVRVRVRVRVGVRIRPQRMYREALQHNSPSSRGQASCGSVHGSVTHSN